MLGGETPEVCICVFEILNCPVLPRLAAPQLWAHMAGVLQLTSSEGNEEREASSGRADGASVSLSSSPAPQAKPRMDTRHF